MSSEDRQWQFIEAKTAEWGVGDEARRKWRSRGVAHRWRLPLLEEARREGIEIDPAIFDHPPSLSQSTATTHAD